MKKFHFLKSKLIKPRFFLGLPIAIFSLETYFGAIFGYFTAKFLSKRLKSLVFDIGNWRLHFHHWLYGLMILISAFYYQFLPFPQFSFGFLGGVVFQGIFCYSDWYKIVFKRKSA